jgi:regulator of protease activity HflC (stomatin/prohibitin superfamily)
MSTLVTVLVLIGLLALLVAALAVRIVKQYEQGVLFRLGRVVGVRDPGLQFIVPFIDVLHRVSLRIITMPIQSQGIITRDNVSVDVSAVAYFRVVDSVKSVVAIENVHAAINQIAQTTLRKVVGQHTLDETLSETDRINLDIRHHRGLGCARHLGRAQGHPAAREHEAGHGQAGRGRAGEARKDHQRRGRVAGSRGAR